MAWINALILVVIGIFIGLLMAWLIMRDNAQHKDLKKALEKSQNELEQYRQELSEHFTQSAHLLDGISRDYNKLYQHMAKTSAELMQHQPEHDNPFAKKLNYLPKPVENPQHKKDQHRDFSPKASGKFT